MGSALPVLFIFNPVWVTLLVLACAGLLLSVTGLWTRYRYWILAAGIAVYAIDAGFALPRVLFSHSLSSHPVIAHKIPLPRQLVLVGIPCSAACHALLISGQVDEILFAGFPSYSKTKKTYPLRYRAGWSIPGTCPHARQRAIDFPSQDLLRTGYCPQVDAASLPSQGIFLVRESTIVAASERARIFRPTFLVKHPPGPTIKFVGIEVQDRAASGVHVVASAYRYEAPSFLGLPPLAGCWNRPDNIIWVIPPGDTGCGLWRWFTQGGDSKSTADINWLYKDAFGPPDRPIVPPKRIKFDSPTPAAALDILANVDAVDDYLSGLRHLVIDPANSDTALRDLIARLAKRGNLEGSLVALLARNRPAALKELSARLDPVPIRFVNSGAVLTEMEADPVFRDAFAETMFRALAADWSPKSKNVDRFFKLMATSHPRWLCARLGRLSGSEGILRARENRAMKSYDEALPPFVPLIVQRTVRVCPSQTATMIRELLSTARPNRRAATSNLLLRVLHDDGQYCDIPTRNFSSYRKQEESGNTVPLETLVSSLETMRLNKISERCHN